MSKKIRRSSRQQMMFRNAVKPTPSVGGSKRFARRGVIGVHIPGDR